MPSFVNAEYTPKSYDLLVRRKMFSTIAIILLAVLISAAILLLVLPWQQTVIGHGEVTVFSPTERPQTLEAMISGKILSIEVKEGDVVKKGQLIVALQDIDPKFNGPSQLNQLEIQKQALLSKQQANQIRLNALMQQQSALLASQQAAYPSAQTKTQQSSGRLLASKQAVIASEQNYKTAQYNFDRTKTLFDQGLKSRRDYELAEQSKVQAETELNRAKTNYQIAEQDIRVAGFEQNKVYADTTASLASVGASIAVAKEAMATLDSDLAKMDIEIQNFKTRVQQREVRAPIDGRIVKLSSFGLGQVVSEGQVIAVVSPKTTDQAVELYIKDWDVPLLRVGRQVRLQFSGWPAIQFAGWPSIATGTFGGKIAVIDAIDSAGGQYRILVKPDYESIKEGHDEPWPSPEYLRAGSKATGWIMLNTVPLWFELWRQFNAFPPTVEPPKEQGSEAGVTGNKSTESYPKIKPKKAK